MYLSFHGERFPFDGEAHQKKKKKMKKKKTHFAEAELDYLISSLVYYGSFGVLQIPNSACVIHYLPSLLFSLDFCFLRWRSWKRFFKIMSVGGKLD